MEQDTVRWVVLLLSILGGGLIGLLRRPPILLVLLLNLVPVAGVLWLGWSPLQLLLIYWVENVVVGLVNYAKLRGYEAHGRSEASPFRISNFFAMHYGMFTLVHGIFAVIVGVVFAPAATAEPAVSQDWWSFWGATFGLSVLHLGDYLRWRETEGWTRASADAQMFAPYGRIIVMHLTILGGVFVLVQTGAPVAYIALLAVLKTIIETGWALMGDKVLVEGADGLTINGKSWKAMRSGQARKPHPQKKHRSGGR